MKQHPNDRIARGQVLLTLVFLLPLVLGTIAISIYINGSANDATLVATAARAAAESGNVATKDISIAAPPLSVAVFWPLFALLALFAAFALPRRISGKRMRRAFQDMTACADAAASGALDRTPEVSLENECGELQSALADALTAFSGTIARIDSAANELKQAGVEMAHTADEAGAAVGEVAQAIGSISTGAGHQVELVAHASEVVGSIERQLNDASEHAREAQLQSADTERLSDDGLQRADEVREAMQEVRETAMTTAAAVRSLGEKSNDIDQIVQTIGNIAAQTNMLALNASIEAARAGEQGKGFSNVADEVRMLADDAQSSAEKIAKLVHDIQTQTDEAVGAMESSITHVERGVETINRNRRTFTDISSAVHALHESSAEIASLAAGTAAGVGTVRSQIESVAGVAQRSSGATERVAISTDQTSTAADSVSTAAQGVAQIAANLADIAGRFRVAA